MTQSDSFLFLYSCPEKSSCEHNVWQTGRRGGREREGGGRGREEGGEEERERESDRETERERERERESDRETEREREMTGQHKTLLTPQRLSQLGFPFQGSAV